MLEFVGVQVAARNFDVTAAFSGVTAVVGPNGSGKSTLLSLAAGGLRPEVGSIIRDGRTLADRRVFVPAHLRRSAYLEQRALLFPHLSVLGNVAFRASRERALAELAAVGCADLADYRPGQLSGGQAQRVALARALAIDPLSILLDEPLAALDATSMPDVRRALRDRLAGRTALLVTHDLLDVLTLADNVCVLEDGRVVEHGPVSALLERPRSPFLADLAGMNLCSGPATASGVDIGGVEIVGIRDEAVSQGDDAFAVFAPSAVTLCPRPPSEGPCNVLPVVVTGLEPHGAVIRVRMDLVGRHITADLTAAVVAELGIVPCDRLYALVKAAQVNIYGLRSATSGDST